MSTPKEVIETGLAAYLADKYGIEMSYPVSLDENTPGQAVVTATLNAPAISNVTVNFTLGGGTPNQLTHKGYHNNPWTDEMLSGRYRLERLGLED